MENNGNDELEQMTRQVIALEKVAKTMMSKEAISRYGNLKMAHPETAIKAIAIIAQAVQMGQINEPLKDSDFKDILMEIQKDRKTYRFKK